MSAPTFFGAGTEVGGVGDVFPTWPAGHATNDYGLILANSSNEAIATPGGWTLVPNTTQGTGVAPAAGSTRIVVFGRRATSGAMGAAAITDPGDHAIARILAFRGCLETGNPWTFEAVDMTAGDVQAASQTGVTIPGITTLTPDCLVVAISSHGTDIFDTARFSAWANADVDGATMTEICDNADSVGFGGGFGAAVGTVTLPKVIGSTTATLATASRQAHTIIVLRPRIVIATADMGAELGIGGFA